jgi:vancomycin resistance protein YoaR
MTERMDQDLTAGAAVDESAGSAAAMPDQIASADPSSAGTVALPLLAPRRSRRTATRFALAFTFGILAVLAISAGALAAYESSNTGRILPGVHVGSVDLSRLSPSEAAARLRSSFGVLGDGILTLRAGDSTSDVTYEDLGRRIDVDAIVAEAMTIGRGGPAIERLASNIRILVGGVEIAPKAMLERAALRFEISNLAAKIQKTARNASVAADKSGFAVTPGTNGASADVDTALRAAEALLDDPAAPAAVAVELPVAVIEPDVTTAEATAAQEAAGRIATDVALVQGNESWTIAGADIRGWITFATASDGTYRPVVAQDGLEAGLAKVAAKVAIAPVSATFLIGNDKTIVGVTSAKDGRALDVATTVATLVKVVEQRVVGLSVSRAAISLTVVEPELTTAEATKTAPLMRPISEWTTYFPIGIKNGYGANIWIPAHDIDGQVVLPGEWFDFWKAIGPVTREHGY